MVDRLATIPAVTGDVTFPGIQDGHREVVSVKGLRIARLRDIYLGAAIVTDEIGVKYVRHRVSRFSACRGH